MLIFSIAKSTPRSAAEPAACARAVVAPEIAIPDKATPADAPTLFAGVTSYPNPPPTYLKHKYDNVLHTAHKQEQVPPPTLS